jgi:hypothetical protein
MSNTVGKEQLLKCQGLFTWMFDYRFFIETDFGNFIWKDPEYGGDNTMEPYPHSYNNFVKHYGYSCGRDKGHHLVSSYCGDEFTVLE